MRDFNLFPTRFTLCIFLMINGACSTPATKLFTKRTPHEAYSNHLKDAGLLTTALGKRWNDAALQALQQPLSVDLPYQETGYFAAEKPAAAGYVFSVKRGQEIRVQISTTPATDLVVFADLFQSTGSDPKFLTAGDDSLQLQFEARADGNYLLRIQPELLQSGSFNLVITNGASLSFPVAPGAGARVGSFFGNSRDRGARSHEGIDIFAKFRTPVVAAADGYVTSVSENNLGGKVVFMRPSSKDYTLYYAHLDSQVATQGKRVKTGDTLGLMGNTGNAKTTPPHLHFGIYTSAGAIDPLPFVEQKNEKPAPVTASLQALNSYVYNSRPATVSGHPNNKSGSVEKINAGTPMLVLGATANWYKVQLPGSKTGYIASASVTTKPSGRLLNADTSMLLFESPVESAPAKKLVAKGAPVQVLGTYNNYYFARADSITGWMRK